MQTRSNSSQSEGDAEHASAPAALPGTKPRCEWPLEDERSLIDFLVRHSSTSGDGTTFKSTIWTAAAEHLETTRKKGAQKTSKACSEKWTRVCDIELNDDSARSHIL
jgi:hypothetical protein